MQIMLLICFQYVKKERKMGERERERESERAEGMREMRVRRSEGKGRESTSSWNLRFLKSM